MFADSLLSLMALVLYAPEPAAATASVSFALAVVSFVFLSRKPKK